MAHRATPSTNLLARVRAWFGLDQAALALYLGVSLELIRSVETGRRHLTTDLFMVLRPLVLHLPPDDAPAPTDGPPPGLPAPETGELGYRRQVCAVQLAKAERELTKIKVRAQVAMHWAQALPALQQAAAEAYAAPATPEEAERGTWLAGWLARHAHPLPAAVATRWHLLRARRVALTAEMQALTEAIAEKATQ